MSTSCEKETENRTEDIQEQDLVGKIIQLGFSLESIEDIGDIYLVEGCIAFDKELLAAGKYDLAPSSAPIEKQRRTLFLVNQQNVRNITVRIDASIPTTGADNWRPEIAQAIADWNNARSALNFVLTTANNADIIIRSDNINGFDNFDDNVIAAALTPTNDGRPGSAIWINLDYLNNQVVPSGRKRYNLVHELGHCVGLSHTNEFQVGSSQINGTPAVDNASVMNGGTAQNLWNGLSNGDREAIWRLYPSCPAGFTFDGANCHSNVWIPTGYNGFIWGNSFFVKPICCPSGFSFDGANCWSGKSFPAGYNGFVLGNAFFVQPNCRISTANNCCPSGFTFDGANCHSGIYYPTTYQAFVWNRTFYTRPDKGSGCNQCPPGFNYDGANCHSGVYFDAQNCQPFIWNGAFYANCNN